MIVGDLHKEVWKFDISGLLNIDVLRCEVGDQVTIHVDLNDASYHLKLAAFVQLSPANAYEGGTLEYGGAPPLDTASREQGSLLIIPAWVAHRVTPVTAGTRYSAVCWAVGPSFR
jgi:PKHD-type hydroxylase